MSRLLWIGSAVLVGVALLASAVVTSAGAWRVARAREPWRDAVHQASTLGAGLERLPVSRNGAPQPDQVATLGRRVLVAAGVAQQTFAGIQPLGDSVLPGGTWHRQQVLLQLRGLSTAQVAAVVDAASRLDPAWAVSSLQPSHTGSGDDGYDAGLSLTTLYPQRP